MQGQKGDDLLTEGGDLPQQVTRDRIFDEGADASSVTTCLTADNRQAQIGMVSIRPGTDSIPGNHSIRENQR